ncbi:hypothetical protein OGAPHI_000103 [Ogataea philodendri]|uniref:Uncharacterized protein n=1 Tax=Ogataea philodendri TaxID=1378263 RepID=A0A9P8PHJ4_9ASCO|nr:uncharacterized protein OGAPHI_000103 [Ogataea philodendri]KAH3671917.1 hypothetical protein OGAPHI_000103 [Ogataea philodendri]
MLALNTSTGAAVDSNCQAPESRIRGSRSETYSFGLDSCMIVSLYKVPRSLETLMSLNMFVILLVYSWVLAALSLPMINSSLSPSSGLMVDPISLLDKNLLYQTSKLSLSSMNLNTVMRSSTDMSSGFFLSISSAYLASKSGVFDFDLSFGVAIGFVLMKA